MHEANPPRRRRAAEPERTLRRSSICPVPPALHAAAHRVRQAASRFFITRAVRAQPCVPPCVRPCSAPRARAHTDAPALPPACHTRGASCPPISTRIAAAARNRKPAHIAVVQGPTPSATLGSPCTTLSILDTGAAVVKNMWTRKLFLTCILVWNASYVSPYSFLKETCQKSELDEL
jgi:hypothetical protein